MKRFNTTENSLLRLRKVTYEDEELLLQWANDPATRASSFETHHISDEEYLISLCGIGGYMVDRYVIATIKSWNIENAKKLAERSDDSECVLVTDKDSLTRERLNKENRRLKRSDDHVSLV